MHDDIGRNVVMWDEPPAPAAIPFDLGSPGGRQAVWFLRADGSAFSVGFDVALELAQGRRPADLPWDEEAFAAEVERLKDAYRRANAAMGNRAQRRARGRR